MRRISLTHLWEMTKRRRKTLSTNLLLTWTVRVATSEGPIISLRI